MESTDLKVIRTREQYEAYLGEVQELMTKAPRLHTPESDRLEILTLLLETYENTKFPIEVPDPIDAIQFRMHEKGLKQADLIPYFGTSSRVSEVLNRKRPLTVQMIRLLSIGLGISAETLVGSHTTEVAAETKSEIDWNEFPIKEMTRRGWLKINHQNAKEAIEATIKDFFSQSGLQFGVASFRRAISGDAQSPTTKYALYAWLARITQTARIKKETIGKFYPESINNTFLKEVAQLSWLDNGPVIAIDFLEKHGIAVIVEPHLKGTQLDGAALKDTDGSPIIGITLRYDRLDNFWFTLMHEIVHIWKHTDNQDTFLDDLDSSSEDRREAEANRIAREAFIPRLIWKKNEQLISTNREALLGLSRELRIHPAIIAGRVRKETGNYQIYTDLLGQNQVKILFNQIEESN